MKHVTATTLAAFLFLITPLYAEDQAARSAGGNETEAIPRTLTIEDQFKIKQVGGPRRGARRSR
jgi:hypothetical protein